MVIQEQLGGGKGGSRHVDYTYKEREPSSQLMEIISSSPSFKKGLEPDEDVNENSLDMFLSDMNFEHV